MSNVQDALEKDSEDNQQLEDLLNLVKQGGRSKLIRRLPGPSFLSLSSRTFFLGPSIDMSQDCGSPGGICSVQGHVTNTFQGAQDRCQCWNEDSCRVRPFPTVVIAFPLSDGSCPVHYPCNETTSGQCGGSAANPISKEHFSDLVGDGRGRKIVVYVETDFWHRWCNAISKFRIPSDTIVYPKHQRDCTRKIYMDTSLLKCLLLEHPHDILKREAGSMFVVRQAGDRHNNVLLRRLDREA